MSVKQPVGGSGRGRQLYHAFYFKTEPVALWLIRDGMTPIEYIQGLGWYAESDIKDYESDVLNSIDDLRATYEELPQAIKNLLGGQYD